ncbi:putative cytochrome P450 [Helianthus debilis subsp. tardiflorus]
MSPYYDESEMKSTTISSMLIVCQLSTNLQSFNTNNKQTNSCLMDLSNLQDNYKLILETFAIILVLYCLSFLYKTTTNPPEASGAWPIIGHYKVFRGSDLPHVPLSSMADRYGPIFTVRLGIRKVLVVSSWDIVKDIFTTHDLLVSNRPNYIATKILGHNGMRRYGEVISEWFQYLGQFLVADALPFLDWLDLGGYKKIMKRVARELDYIVGKWLEEHRRISSFDNVKEENDFMDVLIKVVEDDDVAGYNADTIIKATSATLIAGGSDTTTVMLTWTLSLLLNNPYALRKAQEELDTQVGQDRQVNESDIKNLCYLHAIVKETLRLYPATFLNATRVCTKDCTIAGYHVPKGTWLIVNTWKLHRDPNIWQDPCEFLPERFLSPNQRGVDVIGMDFEMIPFWSGEKALSWNWFGMSNVTYGFSHFATQL